MATLTLRRVFYAVMIVLLMLTLTAAASLTLQMADTGVALAQEDDDDDDDNGDGEAPVGGVETGAGGTADDGSQTLVGAGLAGLTAAAIGAGLYMRRRATR